MNYDNMSNLDIAIKVAEVKKLDWQISAVDGDAVMVDYDVFDPCENPEDAWPIIVEHSIDIEWPEAQLGGTGTARKYMKDQTDIIVEFTDKYQALRAAMIVFLMMQEEA